MRADFFKAKSIIVPVIDRTILCKNLFAVILKINILFLSNASVTLQILLFTSDLDLQKEEKSFFTNKKI